MRKIAGLVSVLIVGVLFYAVAIEPYAIERHDVTVDIPGLAGAFEGYRILHISDIEATTPGLREEEVRRIAEEADPDLVVFTGDLVRKSLEGEARHQALTRMARYLGSLETKDGVLFAQGHGELASRFDEKDLKDRLGREGVDLLLNEVTTVRRDQASLAIGGLRLRHFAGKGVWSVGDDGSARQGQGVRPAYLEAVGAGARDLTDYDFTGRVKFSSPDDWVGMLVHSRMSWRSNQFYMAVRRSHIPFLGASAHGTFYSEGGMMWSRAMSKDTWYRFRVRVRTSGESVHMLARAWEQDLAEPEGWDVRYTDGTATRIAAGTAGVYAEGPGSKEFDDLEVELPGGRVFEAEWVEPAGSDDLLDLLAQAPSGAPLILLSHTPDVLDDAAELGIPLVLAGHTQGGQFRLPWIGPLVKDTSVSRERASGLSRLDRTLLFVNRGVGTSRIPVRFMSRPEVAVITLRGRPS